MMMKTVQSLVFAGLLAQSGASSAAAASAPASPNYCLSGLCLEIDQLSGEKVMIESVSRNLITEITIRNAAGITKLTHQTAADDSCQLASSINLARNGNSYVWNGCVGISVSEERRGRIEIVFIPASSGEEGQHPIGFPIFGIWSVDTSPASFWTNGYALRLGPGVSIRWPQSIDAVQVQR